MTHHTPSHRHFLGCIGGTQPAARSVKPATNDAFCGGLTCQICLSQVVTMAMDRKDREREAASVLLASLHPKMISQVPCCASKPHA